MDYNKAAGHIMIALAYAAGCALSPFSSYLSFSDPLHFFLPLVFTLVSGAFLGAIIFVLISFPFSLAAGYPTKLHIFLTIILVPLLISLVKVYGGRLFS